MRAARPAEAGIERSWARVEGAKRGEYCRRWRRILGC